MFTNSITILEANYSPIHQLESFADTNAILEMTNKLQTPFLQFWTTTTPTVILGINDRHLPKLTSGLTLLTNKDYNYFLRNSGGLAVISDPGVLNVSLFLPTKNQQLSVDEAYKIITDLMKQVLPDLPIEAYEITDSYCPGKYDLSVNGQKIAGIAQRREKDAVVLMLYMSVFGNQDDRSKIISDFYKTSDAYNQTTWDFPKINPASMTSLVELNEHYSNNEIIKKMISDTIQKTYQLNSKSAEVLQTEEFNQLRNKQLSKMKLRNQQLPTIGG
ncbi:lipoyl protein ligase domain-containing protein [Lentilactobacillus sp. SPB1-3]|uniref:Lipoate--protein ligase n=1 Tax=Lentilactobacillus terminaliae TaxID=3003483 RepID=A0ACD5DG38_9LACO|nr:lipoate--protein ligase [Lentilactobacillus sp. SPB1-3]MCZ0977931.1 lipoate--protein ligase [Lentilactobacillus sp. SPB1-3]